MRIEVGDVGALCAELAAKSYKQARPRVGAMPWGTRDMGEVDAFGNRLNFTSAISL